MIGEYNTKCYWNVGSNTKWLNIALFCLLLCLLWYCCVSSPPKDNNFVGFWESEGSSPKIIFVVKDNGAII